MSNARNLTLCWRRADAQMKNRVSQFCKQHNLLYVDRLLLDLLYDLKECSKKDLAQHMHTASESLTRALGRLKKQHLIELKPHKQDGRAMILSLSPQGLQLTKQLRAYTDEMWSSMFEGLSEHKQRAFFDVLQHISIARQH